MLGELARMVRPLSTLTLTVLSFGAVGAAPIPARGAEVAALSLPGGFTVSPESERRAVSVASDGTVAAAAHDSEQHSLGLRWDRTGRRSMLEMARSQPREAPPFVESIVATRGGAFVTLGRTNDGAALSTSFEVRRWLGASRPVWNHPYCSPGGNTSPHVDGVDARGRVALTMDDTGAIIPEATSDGYADPPNAFLVDAAGCHYLGEAVVLSVRGAWAGGYRGYLGRFIAPTVLNAIVQRAVAVRWHGQHLAELGGGVAYAVNANGLAVGATAVAGRFEKTYGNFFGPAGEYDSAVPHAVGWDAVGRRFAIGGPAERSVAYDVSDDGTIVGMLQDRDGGHYAFRQRAGTFERLDDLPHPPGWRFESAYAIGGDGTIVGVGTSHGRAMVFRWRP